MVGGVPLRFERLPVYYEGYLSAKVFLVVIAVKLAVFVVFRLYDHWWRYVSIRDMWAVARAAVVASLVSGLVIYLWYPFIVRLPRGIFLSTGSSSSGSSPARGCSRDP